MAENTGTADRRELKISDRVLVVLAVMAAAILLAAVFIVPRYGKAFSAYREAHKGYSEVRAEYKEAEQTQQELTQTIDEINSVNDETNVLMTEVFATATQLEQDISDGKSDKKICYITIDDGPYNKGRQFLELFDKYDVKATFFLTTANGDKLPDQADQSARSMYPEYLRHGHVIGNHTYTHNYSDGGIYSSTAAFMKSVNDQQDFTENATDGYIPKIVRFPGGSSTAGSELENIESALREEGLTWVDWTVDSGDSWGSDRASASLVKENVMKAAEEQDIMVILFHEWSTPSLEAMPGIIESLQKKGYIFLPLFPESIMVKK